MRGDSKIPSEILNYSSIKFCSAKKIKKTNTQHYPSQASPEIWRGKQESFRDLLPFLNVAFTPSLCPGTSCEYHPTAGYIDHLISS